MILLHVLEFRISNVEMEFCDDTGNVNMFRLSINLTFMIVEIFIYIYIISLSLCLPLSLSPYIYLYIYTHIIYFTILYEFKAVASVFQYQVQVLDATGTLIPIIFKNYLGKFNFYFVCYRFLRFLFAVLLHRDSTTERRHVLGEEMTPDCSFYLGKNRCIDNSDWPRREFKRTETEFNHLNCLKFALLLIRKYR